ncbi:hypothetical protein I2486_03030 [Cellulophaga sp. E16_2]|uniref:Uncharacterized protein n=1 Tax=Cellulophaga algicola (strain DSM 14237 / IC166 / ACAM 630) TaxID=688270 RepID=E6XCD9_CELAD|nr:MULTISPECIES: hypothetical protein [Cellulophaga]ADV47914.1 hypothetical protein Celal_0575 [Cellulophaga algicola DSM 14237]MBO0590370.1 hypothetical protein [Cellulophaga sp. E16_2]
MKKIFSVALAATSLLFLNCESTDKKFNISTGVIGQLTKDTKVMDLETIYAEDSIVAENGIPNLNLQLGFKNEVLNDTKTDTTRIIQSNFIYNKIDIYEKGGKQLLSLTPSRDSIPKIENIRIYDPRYISDKGISTASTFKDIKEKYSIKKIITSMNNVVILLKDTGLYFTIDKQELPSSLRYDSSANIEEVQIPDGAKIKYMMLAWE